MSYRRENPTNDEYLTYLFRRMEPLVAKLKFDDIYNAIPEPILAFHEEHVFPRLLRHDDPRKGSSPIDTGTFFGKAGELAGFGLVKYLESQKILLPAKEAPGMKYVRHFMTSAPNTTGTGNIYYRREYQNFMNWNNADGNIDLGSKLSLAQTDAEAALSLPRSPYFSKAVCIEIKTSQKNSTNSKSRNYEAKKRVLELLHFEIPLHMKVVINNKHVRDVAANKNPHFPYAIQINLPFFPQLQKRFPLQRYRSGEFGSSLIHD